MAEGSEQIRQMLAALEQEAAGANDEQAQMWYRASMVFAAFDHMLGRHADALAAAWPPERNEAARAFFTHVDALRAPLAAASDAAARNGSALTSVADSASESVAELRQAYQRSAELNAEREALGSEAGIGAALGITGRQGANHLQAWGVFEGYKTDVVQAPFTQPPTYTPPFERDPYDPELGGGTGISGGGGGAVSPLPDSPGSGLIGPTSPGGGGGGDGPILGTNPVALPPAIPPGGPATPPGGGTPPPGGGIGLLPPPPRTVPVPPGTPIGRPPAINPIGPGPGQPGGGPGRGLTPAPVGPGRGVPPVIGGPRPAPGVPGGRVLPPGATPPVVGGARPGPGAPGGGGGRGGLPGPVGSGRPTPGVVGSGLRGGAAGAAPGLGVRPAPGAAGGAGPRPVGGPGGAGVRAGGPASAIGGATGGRGHRRGGDRSGGAGPGYPDDDVWTLPQGVPPIVSASGEACDTDPGPAIGR